MDRRSEKYQSIIKVVIGSVPVVTIDTLRVFMIRIFQGRSPFGSDRNHLHHLLTDLGMTHIRATAALISFNVVVVAIVLGFQKVRSEIVLSAVLTLCMLTSFFLANQRNKKRKFSVLKVRTSADLPPQSKQS